MSQDRNLDSRAGQGTAAFGWRQRGYSAAISRRKPHPPDDPALAAAYRDGYRTAERELERRKKSPES